MAQGYPTQPRRRQPDHRRRPTEAAWHRRVTIACLAEPPMCSLAHTRPHRNHEVVTTTRAHGRSSSSAGGAALLVEPRRARLARRYRVPAASEGGRTWGRRLPPSRLWWQRPSQRSGAGALAPRSQESPRCRRHARSHLHGTTEKAREHLYNACCPLLTRPRGWSHAPYPFMAPPGGIMKEPSMLPTGEYGAGSMGIDTPAMELMGEWTPW